jgi:hypothetical protein
MQRNSSRLGPEGENAADKMEAISRHAPMIAATQSTIIDRSAGLESNYERRRLDRQEDVSLDLNPLLRGMLSHQEAKIAPEDHNQIGAFSAMVILVLASAVAWTASLLLLVALW